MNRQKILTRNKALPDIPKVQCRRLALDQTELRFVQPSQAGGPVKISGYAVKWESVNSYGEQFVKGAFADLINAVLAGSKKVHQYYNHGWRYFWIDSRCAYRVGKWTLLQEDDVGLYVEGELTPRLSLADDVGAMLEHGTIDGLSIAFFPPAPMDVEELPDRIRIKRVDLYEISLCDEPSDNNARIISDDSIDSIESEEDAVEQLRNFNIPDAYAEKLIQRLNSLAKPATTQPTTEQADPLGFLDRFNH